MAGPPESEVVGWTSHESKSISRPRSRRCVATSRMPASEIVATNEVLAAMGRSASDLNLVLGTIVDSARRLSEPMARCST